MFLFQQAEGEDELKKRQLMELAIINGTYRDSSAKASAAGGFHLFFDYLLIAQFQQPQLE